MARELTNLPIRNVYVPERKNMSFEKDPILLLCRRSLFLFFPSASDLKQLDRTEWAKRFSSSDLMALSSRYTGRTFFRKALSRKAIASILLKHTTDTLKKHCTSSRIAGPYPSRSCIISVQGKDLKITDHEHCIYQVHSEGCAALAEALRSCGFTVTDPDSI